ncbi:cytochrome c oxidase subunit 3 [Schlesneria sp. T3-172]|uniref:cytochrome c oxidase subunit 3 n=1 Tax=Schlesneria sphaerica TaxID=3373610 RepID=UPI0037C96AE3
MAAELKSVYALRFFLLATSTLAVAAVVSLALCHAFPPQLPGSASRFSSAFILSTWLLMVGSGFLLRAIEAVRRERQIRFRRSLSWALATGALFVSVQAYALNYLIQSRTRDEASSAMASFVAVITALHAMHFMIALLFLCYIIVQANADRYDHEYYWGVTIAAWFWHALGIVWIVILFVMAIARLYE